MSSERELLKELERLKGIAQRAVATGAVTQERIEEVSRVEPVGHLAPVFRYYDSLKHEPRMALIARFRQVFEREAPNAKRDWLTEALGRKFQRDHYAKTKGVVPTSVRNNDYTFWHTPVALLRDGERDEGDEVNFNNPAVRIVAAAPNPFEKGRAWRIFLAIESCKDGLSYVALVKLLERLLECSVPVAQAKAKKAFTKWVRLEWTRLTFVEES